MSVPMPYSSVQVAPVAQLIDSQLERAAQAQRDLLTVPVVHVAHHPSSSDCWRSNRLLPRSFHIGAMADGRVRRCRKGRRLPFLRQIRLCMPQPSKEDTNPTRT